MLQLKVEQQAHGPPKQHNGPQNQKLGQIMNQDSFQNFSGHLKSQSGGHAGGQVILDGVVFVSEGILQVIPEAPQAAPGYYKDPHELQHTNDGREDGLNDMVNHKAHFLYVFGTASMP